MNSSLALSKLLSRRFPRTNTKSPPPTLPSCRFVQPHQPTRRPRPKSQLSLIHSIESSSILEYTGSEIHVLECTTSVLRWRNYPKSTSSISRNCRNISPVRGMRSWVIWREGRRSALSVVPVRRRECSVKSVASCSLAFRTSTDLTSVSRFTCG